jgi:hypothetical protein
MSMSSGEWHIPQEWFKNLFRIAWQDETESDGVLCHVCPIHHWFKDFYSQYHPFEEIKVKMNIYNKVQDGADYLYVKREINLVLPEGMRDLYGFTGCMIISRKIQRLCTLAKTAWRERASSVGNSELSREGKLDLWGLHIRVCPLKRRT